MAVRRHLIVLRESPEPDRCYQTGVALSYRCLADGRTVGQLCRYR